jgi:hypothetical protein
VSCWKMSLPAVKDSLWTSGFRGKRRAIVSIWTLWIEL